MRAVFTTLFIFAAALASAQTPAADKPFTPVSGQAGKDVVWVPSPPQMVDKMMEVAKIGPGDYVIDLGSGDGRNVIAAAKLGATAVGVEFNPDMVRLSQRAAVEAGVANKATFVEHDMYTYDISKATALALFLLPVNLNKLAPKFLELKPGSRIVGNTFGIDGWEPDFRTTMPATSECESWCEVLLWIVPAKVAGTWNMAGGSMELTQEYQRVQGTVTIGGVPHKVIEGRLNGAELTFTADGAKYAGKVSGNTIQGTVTSASGAVTPWSAKK